jgi:hypothetical protein
MSAPDPAAGAPADRGAPRTAVLGEARRYVDAVLVAGFGVFCLAYHQLSTISAFWTVLLGIGLIGYGGYIAFAGRSYYMSNFFYVAAVALTLVLLLR